jgi:hypothetical protein
VVKPAYGTGGLGLQVLADLSAIAKADVKEQSGLIVQQYIASPLLLDSRKFSVRLYAVSCVGPCARLPRGFCCQCLLRHHDTKPPQAFAASHRDLTNQLLYRDRR